MVRSLEEIRRATAARANPVVEEDDSFNLVEGISDVALAPLRGVEGDGPHVVATQVLGDFEHQSVFDILHLEGVENRGQRSLELHVHDGTNNLRNLSFCDR